MVPSSTTHHVSEHTYNNDGDKNKEYVVNAADDDDEDGTTFTLSICPSNVLR